MTFLVIVLQTTVTTLTLSTFPGHRLSCAVVVFLFLFGRLDFHIWHLWMVSPGALLDD